MLVEGLTSVAFNCSGTNTIYGVQYWTVLVGPLANGCWLLVAAGWPLLYSMTCLFTALSILLTFLQLTVPCTVPTWNTYTKHTNTPTCTLYGTYDTEMYCTRYSVLYLIVPVLLQYCTVDWTTRNS